MSQELKPCPACDAAAEYSHGRNHVACTNHDCNLLGPSLDPDGKKWNTMPRRGDAAEPAAAPVMDGYELMARASIGVSIDCDFPFDHRTEESQAWHRDNGAHVKAELDRRAAARKAAT